MYMWFFIAGVNMQLLTTHCFNTKCEIGRELSNSPNESMMDLLDFWRCGVKVLRSIKTRLLPVSRKSASETGKIRVAATGNQDIDAAVGTCILDSQGNNNDTGSNCLSDQSDILKLQSPHLE